MFKSILNNSRLIGINATIITCYYLQKKLSNTLFNSDYNKKNQTNPDDPFNKYNFQTLNRDNPNLDPAQKNRKVDDKVKRMVNEYRAAALFEDYADLLTFSDEEIPASERMLMAREVGWENVPSIKKKQYEEEYISIGSETLIPNRSYVQFDVSKFRRDEEIRNRKSKGEDTVENLNNPEVDQTLNDEYINDPEKLFQKILIFRIKDKLFSTSSFCGYDLTDLKNGALLGNKLVCPSCLSEYNIETGMSEAGPNTKFLATFNVAIRKGEIVVRLPKGRIPLFSHGPSAEPNELDPRHFILIGDNETVFACAENLRKTFQGKLSIVTHKCGNDFVDQNKLTKSFFPLKMRQGRFVPPGWLDFFQIGLYDEKVVKINSHNRMLTLSSGLKLPFDKVLIATGSNRKSLNNKQTNCFELNTIKDHAKIHNSIIKPETQSIAVVGNTFRSMEIVSSLRRYLDAIDKQDTKIYLITKKEGWILEKLGFKDEHMKMITEYFKRNRILVFSGVKDFDFEVNEEENKLKRMVLLSDKYAFKLPADVYIFDNPIIVSNVDFIKNIIIKKTIEEDTFGSLLGNVILPDERMSLHNGDRYAHVFTAGSCSAIRSNFEEGLIRTDNVKTNFHLGYIAALNMSEVHYPFDDVIVNQAKILDKNLYLIGNDNLSGAWDNYVLHLDPKEERFVIYYFMKNKLSNVAIYGYNRLHIFVREAMRMKIMPDFKYIAAHKDTAHLSITQEVLKAQDGIECFRHKAMRESVNINTTKYSIEDQAYSDDVMKRGISSFKELEEKGREELRIQLDKDEEDAKRKEEANKKYRKV